MEMYNVLKTKVPFSLALLLIMVMAVSTEQIFLQAIKENKKATDAAVILSLQSNSRNFGSWPSNLKEKIALTGVNVPLIPGAQRITFDNSYQVRYRVKASASLVADFYRQILASQGWKSVTKASAGTKSEKLTITYAENPLSKKTDITYAYSPRAVLGVKIAEADSVPPPAPAPAPAPDNTLPPPPDNQLPPPPPDTPAPQPDSGAIYQPRDGQPRVEPMTGTANPPDQPSQPMPPDGQYQPQPRQSGDQMEFARPPMQPFPGDQGGTQTCRVNGEDKPGNCGQYNESSRMNQGPDGRGQDGQMGPEGRQGPSEEEQKKMDERRFKDMKRGLSQFANGAKMMKKMLVKVKAANAKCGVGVPEELVNALDQTDALVGKINSAKTAEELEEVMADIQDVGSVMQDWGPRMGDLSRLCQMLKQADRDMKQFDRAVKKLESQAKSNKKVDVSELIAEYKTAVNAQKDILAQAKELAKTDQDEALAKIEDEFYGNMDNLGNLEMQINSVMNISKGIKDLAREINSFTSQIKSLAKKKVDVKTLQESLNSLKSRIEEIKSLIQSKADPDELVNKIEEAFDIRQELQDALQEYDLIKTEPKLKSVNNFNVKVNLPEAFRKNENNNDDNND